MIDWIKKLLTSAIAQSVIRKLMVLVSGFLLGIGLDPTVVGQFVSSAEQVVIAVILYLIAQLWSIAAKKVAPAK